MSHPATPSSSDPAAAAAAAHDPATPPAPHTTTTTTIHHHIPSVPAPAPAPASSPGFDLESMLRMHPLFAGLDAEAPGFFRALATLGTMRHVTPGDVLIRAGEEGRALFLILRGAVAVTSKDGESVYATHSAGSFFGEIAMVMEGIRRTASVVATERSVLMVLQRGDLRDVINARFRPAVEERIRQAAEARIAALHPNQRLYMQQQQVETGATTPGHTIGGTGAASAGPSRRASISPMAFSQALAAMATASANAGGGAASLNPSTSSTMRSNSGSAISPAAASPPGSHAATTEFHAATSGGSLAPLSLLSAGSSGATAATDMAISPSSGGGIGLQDMMSLFSGPVGALGLGSGSKHQSHSTLSAGSEHGLSRASSGGGGTGAGGSFGLAEEEEENEDDSFHDSSSNPASSAATSRHTSAVNSVDELDGTPAITFDHADSAGSGSAEYDPCAPGPAPPAAAVVVELPATPANPNKHVSAIAALNPSRRRASVAVWSDPRLMKMANESAAKAVAAMAANSVTASLGVKSSSRFAASTESLTPGSATGSTFDLGRRTMSCESSVGASTASGLNSVPSVTLQSVFFEHPRVAARIVRGLPVRERFRLRVACLDMVHWFQNHREAWCADVDLGGLKTFDDAALAIVAQGCGPFIKRMNLKGCFAVTDAGITPFLQRCAILTDLNLHGCWEISPAAFAATAVAQTLPSVRSVDLSNLRKMDDVALRKCLLMFPKLEELSLGYCKALSAAMFALETSSTSSAAPKPSEEGPQSAPATTTTETAPVLPLTAAAAAPLTTAVTTTWDTLRHLRSLNLQRCTGLRDDAFLVWPAISAAWSLETLILGDCSLLSDIALAAICSVCPSLHTLGLAFCCALSEDSAVSLAGLTHLRTLDVSFCGSLVSHASVATIARGCRKLERLGMRGCVRVDDAMLDLLADGDTAPPQLAVVNFSQCRAVTPAARERAKQKWTCLDTESVVEYVPQTLGRRATAPVGHAAAAAFASVRKSAGGIPVPVKSVHGMAAGLAAAASTAVRRASEEPGRARGGPGAGVAR
ncbi:hypothetical protein H9P43_007808 [Blastocladiella emersonii ATCC 22665]|nr:hypothetical protein H9P43_007808 [Blastocladiella emersonii ATCC 22665]